jgi:predicted exporter
MAEQGDPVHEHGARLRQMVAQPVEDREAVRADIPPVDHVQADQPAEQLKHRDGVTAAQDHYRLQRDREREVGDLVLKHVGPGDALRPFVCRPRGASTGPDFLVSR